jgi:uncharacterized protein
MLNENPTICSMTPAEYTPRVIDAELEARLRSSGAVVLEGPKASGKTFSAREVAAATVMLDVDADALAAAKADPSVILDGRPTPLLIDEWQVVPELWNHVRRAVDDRGLPGQFILTGSAVPADDITRHTGAARIVRIRMRPMSLFESGHSNGRVSLAALLAGEPIRGANPGHSLRDIIDRICVGGWPAFQQLGVEDALVAVAAYLDEIRRTDISRVDGTSRDPERARKVLRSIARNVGTLASVARIAADTANVDQAEPPGDDAGGQAIARNTAQSHVEALQRLMIVENQPAWSVHLRSRASLRVTEKLHFVDPSLAVAALGASPARLLRDLNYVGFLFESLVTRDLRIYAQHADAVVSHYRDNFELEVDAVVEARDGRWAGFEVKLGGEDQIESAVSSLLKFAERIDTKKSGEPARLGIITATGYGYTRPDGIAVIPIGTLSP